MCPRTGGIVACDHAQEPAHNLKALDPLADLPTDGNDALAVAIAENPDLVEGLACGGGATAASHKRIPVRFLYDDLGSEIYTQITETPEYYPYNEEKNLLHRHADDIASHLPTGAVLVELGCGDGSKTALLLQALARRDGPAAVRFVGIDVSGGALAAAQKNLTALCPEIPATNLEFIEAEYFPGLAEAHRRYPDATLCMLWLGSSVGNFHFDEAAPFLRELRQAAGPRTALLLCTDLWKDPNVLHLAYDDPAGVTRRFILNGMDHALRVLGHPAAGRAAVDGGAFTYDCVVNAERRQVEMWAVAAEKVSDVLPGVSIAAGERVLMEISRKFTPEDVAALSNAAGLCVQAAWASPKYAMQLLLPPAEALRRCWADTDALFARIADWSAQPIGLRHPYKFYYGHVASFARLKLLPGQTPSQLDTMLSRGIDPIVLDPSKCHSHPEIPAQWPTEDELKTYVAEARADALGAAAKAGNAPASMHALVMALEHERMHQETLMYMVTQQRRHEWTQSAANGTSHSANGTLNDVPAPFVAPEPFYFEHTSYLASAIPGDGSNASPMVIVPGGTVTLGVDPSDRHGYHWDNELGLKGPISVDSLHVSAFPVTVGEFRRFALEEHGYQRPELWDSTDFEHFQASGQSLPATWSLDNDGEVHVHAPEGTFHWSKVARCPVLCSLAEAQAFARARGGRIMTEAEHQHLVAAAAGGSGVEFLEEGGWEWTATEFGPFEGFKPDPLYPEYSTDFFDGAHYVLRGSSPYTHPSVRRRVFRNFYQGQYPYMFAKFRVVVDVKDE